MKNLRTLCTATVLTKALFWGATVFGAQETPRNIRNQEGVLRQAEAGNCGWYAIFFMYEMVTQRTNDAALTNMQNRALFETFFEKQPRDLARDLETYQICDIIKAKKIPNACYVQLRDNDLESGGTTFLEYNDVALNKPIGLVINVGGHWIGGKALVDNKGAVSILLADSTGRNYQNSRIVTKIYDFLVKNFKDRQGKWPQVTTINNSDGGKTITTVSNYGKKTTIATIDRNGRLIKEVTKSLRQRDVYGNKEFETETKTPRIQATPAHRIAEHDDQADNKNQDEDEDVQRAIAMSLEEAKESASIAAQIRATDRKLAEQQKKEANDLEQALKASQAEQPRELSPAEVMQQFRELEENQQAAQNATTARSSSARTAARNAQPEAEEEEIEEAQLERAKKLSLEQPEQAEKKESLEERKMAEQAAAVHRITQADEQEATDEDEQGAIAMSPGQADVPAKQEAATTQTTNLPRARIVKFIPGTGDAAHRVIIGFNKTITDAYANKFFQLLNGSRPSKITTGIYAGNFSLQIEHTLSRETFQASVDRANKLTNEYFKTH
jgi:hypothetical protein